MDKSSQCCWPARCTAFILTGMFVSASSFAYAHAPVDQATAQNGASGPPPEPKPPGPPAGGNWNQPRPEATAPFSLPPPADAGGTTGASGVSSDVKNAQESAAEAKESSEVAKKAAQSAKAKAAAAEKARIRTKEKGAGAKSKAATSKPATMNDESTMKQQKN